MPNEHSLTHAHPNLAIVQRANELFLIGARTCHVSLRQKLLDQLWAIACRARSGSNWPGTLAVIWGDGFVMCSVELKSRGYHDRARNGDETFCALPGCKNREPTTLACKCQTPYCSQECQRQCVPFLSCYGCRLMSLTPPGTGKGINHHVKQQRSSVCRRVCNLRPGGQAYLA